MEKGMGLEELGESKAVRLMYVNCEVCVNEQGGISDWFQVQ